MDAEVKSLYGDSLSEFASNPKMEQIPVNVSRAWDKAAAEPAEWITSAAEGGGQRSESDTDKRLCSSFFVIPTCLAYFLFYRHFRFVPVGSDVMLWTLLLLLEETICSSICNINKFLSCYKCIQFFMNDHLRKCTHHDASTLASQPRESVFNPEVPPLIQPLKRR